MKKPSQKPAVVMISTDASILKDGSAVQSRMKEYGGLFSELHIILFLKTVRNPEAPQVLQVGQNVLVYPTMSVNRWFYLFDALGIGKRILSRLLTRMDKKHIVISTQDPFETGIVGKKLKDCFGVALNVQIHTDFFSPFFPKVSVLNRIRLILANKVLPSADSVRAVSGRIKQSVISKYKIAEDKIIVLPIFTHSFARLKAVAEETAVSMDVSKKYPQFNFVALMVCRLEAEKNIPLALNVCAALVKKYPDFGLVIVGDGSQFLPMRLLASRLDIADHVVFEGWQKNLAPFYASAHLFLSTSFYEGYGMAMVEAASAGLPVVASDAGVAGEILKDGENAFICPVNDAKVFVTKISQLIENPGDRERLKTAAVASIPSVTYSSKEVYLEQYAKSILMSLSV